MGEMMEDLPLVMVISLIIAISGIFVHSWGNSDEREKWCKHTYEKHAEAETCYKEPDWRKK
jgi:FtsZ-interacting cell division protein ZipA